MGREVELQLSRSFWKGTGEFAAGVVVAKNRIDNSIAAERAWEESLENGGCGAIGDVECHWSAADIDNDDWFSDRGNRPNEIVLAACEIKTGAGSALTDRAANTGDSVELIADHDNRDIGLACVCGGLVNEMLVFWRRRVMENLRLRIFLVEEVGAQ